MASSSSSSRDGADRDIFRSKSDLACFCRCSVVPILITVFVFFSIAKSLLVPFPDKVVSKLCQSDEGRPREVSPGLASRSRPLVPGCAPELATSSSYHYDCDDESCRNWVKKCTTVRQTVRILNLLKPEVYCDITYRTII